MNTGHVIAPPPALRRRRPLRVEPVLFALALGLLTLGINLGSAPAPEQAVQQPAPAQVAQAR